MKTLFYTFTSLVITFSNLFAQSVNEDLLVVLKNDGKISAYNLNTLESQWNFQFSDSSYNKMRNQFKIEDNILYAISTQNQLVSLNINNGKVNWKETIFEQEEITKRYEISGQRLPILNNMIFAANNVNGLNAYDKRNGKLIWNSTMHYPFNNYPPIIKNNKVYIQSAPLVYCIDASTGSLLWYKDFKTQPMYTLITINDEYVFVGDEDNTIYALDVDTGDEKWQYSTVYEYPNIDENIMFSKNENQIVLGAEQENGFSIIALNPRNGEEKWKSNFDNTSKKIKSITQISNYYIVTTDDNDQYFYLVDIKTGKSISIEFPKEKPLSNIIKYRDDEIAFLTKSFFITLNLKNKIFEYKPIKIDYEINDNFNLHFDIVYKTK